MFRMLVLVADLYSREQRLVPTRTSTLPYRHKATHYQAVDKDGVPTMNLRIMAMYVSCSVG